MKFGRETTNQPEYLEDARTIQEALFAYDGLMQQAVVEHQAQFTDVVSAHDRAFSEELEVPNSVNIHDTMQSTAAHVQQAVKPVGAKVDGVIKAAAEVIPTMLDSDSLKILREAKSEAATFGIDSPYVTRVLRKAPPSTRIALEAALDAHVFAYVKEQAGIFGVASQYVTRALDQASSTAVRTAMVASLDAAVLAHVDQKASIHGVDSLYTHMALGNASTAIIRSAMEVTLDANVLKSAKSEASIHGVDSLYTRLALDRASSKNVQEVFAKHIGAERQGRYVEDAPRKLTRGERLRSLAGRTAGAAALAATVAAASYGLVEASKPHTGPNHDAKTEAAIERIITPEMQKIAKTALKLEADKPTRMEVTHPTRGVTEIQSYFTDGVGSIDVVMRNFPGTQTPNPADVLATDLQSNLNPGAKKGITAYNEVLYAAPNSVKYLSANTLTGVYEADNEGWTAIASHDDSQDGKLDLILSGAIDTAESDDYAVDDNDNSVGPVKTARDTLSFAETFRPIIAEEINSK